MPRHQIIPGQSLASLCISLRADQKQALEALARDDENSVSHECRRAVDEYLAHRGRLPVRPPVAVPA